MGYTFIGLAILTTSFGFWLIYSNLHQEAKQLDQPDPQEEFVFYTNLNGRIVVVDRNTANILAVQSRYPNPANFYPVFTPINNQDTLLDGGAVGEID